MYTETGPAMASPALEVTRNLWHHRRRSRPNRARSAQSGVLAL